MVPFFEWSDTLGGIQWGIENEDSSFLHICNTLEGTSLALTDFIKNQSMGVAQGTLYLGLDF